MSLATILDWVVVGESGVLFLACAAGAAYVLSYGGRASRHAGASFNYLWRSRLCFQVSGASYALVQLLRLQVLWGPDSVFGRNAAHAGPLCRAYIATEYGLLEPVSLLLALLSCFYAIQSKLSPPVTRGAPRGSPPRSRDVSASGVAAMIGGTSPQPAAPAPAAGRITHPNFRIVLYSLGFTLPFMTAQLICAIFTRVFDLDYTDVTLFRLMFGPYDNRQVEHCPADAPPSSCVWCVYPLLSTLVSSGFLVAWLLALWVVLRRVVAAAINKGIILRVRVLQVVVTLCLLGSMACRAVTVLFDPFELGFELLRLGHVLLWGAALLVLSWILVWQPVKDAKAVDAELAAWAAGPPPHAALPPLSPWLSKTGAPLDVESGGLASGLVYAAAPPDGKAPEDGRWSRRQRGSAGSRGSPDRVSATAQGKGAQASRGSGSGGGRGKGGGGAGSGRSSGDGGGGGDVLGSGVGVGRRHPAGLDRGSGGAAARGQTEPERQPLVADMS